MWFRDKKPEVQDVETKVVRRINADLTELERKYENLTVRIVAIEARSQKFEARFYKHVQDETKSSEDEEDQPMQPKGLKPFTGVMLR